MAFAESARESWGKRYGDEAPMLDASLDIFLRHRSVRKFSPMPISEGRIAGLVAAGQSASTSSNLQMWSLVSVQDPERRKQIAALCGNQKQIIECAWFFAVLLDHHRTRVVAESAGIDPDGLDTYECMLVGAIDAALAAERMVCAAEAQGLGICYIGALRNRPAEVAELLNLPHGTFGVFGLCIGVPADDEKGDIKPRLDQHAIWFEEQYPDEIDFEPYNARMSSSLAERGLTFTWAEQVGRRVQLEGMSGREALGNYLRSIGIGVR
jgi:nitroreductase